MAVKGVKKYVQNGLFTLVLIFLLFYLLFPFYWALVSSLTPPNDLFLLPVNYLPASVSLESYQNLFRNADFMKGLVNSAIVSLSATALSLIFGSFAAYALARLSFRGKRAILYTVLAMTMVPAVALAGSLFTFVHNPCIVLGGNCQALSLYNTRLALIITYLVFSLPFTIWVLTHFFQSLPADLEQAALVDGATPFQTFYLVWLPLTRPAVITTGLLTFIMAWNEFIFALTLTSDSQARTVQPVIAFFQGAGGHETPWGTIMAASVVVTIPFMGVALIFQRRLNAGLTAGLVKEASQPQKFARPRYDQEV